MAFFGNRILPFRNRKKDIPGGLWDSCPSCKEMLYLQEMNEALGVCTHCNHHFSLPREDRIAMFADEGSFEEWDEELLSVDTLKFTGTASYSDKLEQNRAKTGYNDAISCGKARMSGYDVGLGVMDFKFLGASMGAVLGEKVTRLIEKSTEANMPVVLVCASGGARMYEGLFSLMQMAKTSGALARHAQAGLPYFSILTHPTTAGVMASFATLGDVIIAEPEALIGFAGPRVIKETTQQDLPDGFQRSEFLLKHGLLDMIVHRHDLKQRVVDLLGFWMPSSAKHPVPVDGPMGIKKDDVVEAPKDTKAKASTKRRKKGGRGSASSDAAEK